MNNMKRRVKMMIYGDVTGGGLRYWTRNQAKELGLTGYVLNVDRGQVEAVFEGEKGQVEEMIERCSRGPEVSRVEKTVVKWENATGEFSVFEIRY